MLLMDMSWIFIDYCERRIALLKLLTLVLYFRVLYCF
jgi:hypothetical protein